MRENLSRAKRSAHQTTAEGEPAPMFRYFRFETDRPGILLKWSMRPQRGKDRMPDIVRPIRGIRLLALLRLITGPAEIVVQKARNELLTYDCFHCRAAHPVLPSWPCGTCSMQDDPRAYFRLVNGRHRLGKVREPALYPGELRRIHSRHVNEDRFHIAPVMIELATQRVGESSDGMFGGAIG